MYKKKITYFILAITMMISSLCGLNTQSLAMENKEREIAVAIESYMLGRQELFSLGTSNQLSEIVVSGILEDEILHREVLAEKM